MMTHSQYKTIIASVLITWPYWLSHRAPGNTWPLWPHVGLASASSVSELPRNEENHRVFAPPALPEVLEVGPLWCHSCALYLYQGWWAHSPTSQSKLPPPPEATLRFLFLFAKHSRRCSNNWKSVICKSSLQKLLLCYFVLCCIV